MTVFLGPRGGRKRAVPAVTVDTLRGRRKGDLQQQMSEKMNINKILEMAHTDFVSSIPSRPFQPLI